MGTGIIIFWSPQRWAVSWRKTIDISRTVFISSRIQPLPLYHIRTVWIFWELVQELSRLLTAQVQSHIRLYQARVTYRAKVIYIRCSMHIRTVST